ncbi:MAG: TetR/AcrR family transcriptional regulator [Clostridia bacterium]|nr:TetR/AcrR family transcriptional regulator [Clostridia bacterium]
MNKLTSRQLKALETKKAIFESAITLFKEQGFDNVSIDDVAQRAGTSKGSFYTHFKSKSQIIIEQFQKMDDHYLDIASHLWQYNSATEKLLAFAKEQLIFIKEKVGLDVLNIVYITQLTDSSEKIVVDENRPLYRIIQQIITEGQNSGEFRDDLSSIELTRFVARCMRASFFDWCVHNGSYDIVDDRERFFSTFVIKGLQK